MSLQISTFMIPRTRGVQKDSYPYGHGIWGRYIVRGGKLEVLEAKGAGTIRDYRVSLRRTGQGRGGFAIVFRTEKIRQASAKSNFFSLKECKK